MYDQEGQTALHSQLCMKNRVVNIDGGLTGIICPVSISIVLAVSDETPAFDLVPAIEFALSQVLTLKDHTVLRDFSAQSIKEYHTE